LTRPSTFALGALTLGLALSSAAMAQTVPPLDAAIKPTRESGMGLRVSDLERSMRFYTEVLGYKIDQKVPAQGKTVEYLLGYTGDSQADALLVISQGVVQPGATAFGRLILTVPNGRALAQRVAANGGTVDKLADGTNIVKDPDGYVIELYQRAAPSPAK
jgi:lactoylglutathione lyase